LDGSPELLGPILETVARRLAFGTSSKKKEKKKNLPSCPEVPPHTPSESVVVHAYPPAAHHRLADHLDRTEAHAALSVARGTRTLGVVSARQ